MASPRKAALAATKDGPLHSASTPRCLDTGSPTTCATASNVASDPSGRRPWPRTRSTSKATNSVSDKVTNDELKRWLESLNDEDLGRYKM